MGMYPDNNSELFFQRKSQDMPVTLLHTRGKSLEKLLVLKGTVMQLEEWRFPACMLKFTGRAYIVEKILDQLELTIVYYLSYCSYAPYQESFNDFHLLYLSSILSGHIIV